jgi:hypothetical protein
MHLSEICSSLDRIGKKSFHAFATTDEQPFPLSLYSKMCQECEKYILVLERLCSTVIIIQCAKGTTFST